MSDGKIEIVRRVYAAASRRDLGEMLDLCDDDAEFAPLVGDGEPYRGPDGARRLLAELDQVWSEFTIEVREAIAIGDNVVATLHARRRGRRSGGEIETFSVAVWSFQRDKLWRGRHYASRAEALDAAGLGVLV
jgi:ketosteroid isomerase-like protein